MNSLSLQNYFIIMNKLIRMVYVSTSTNPVKSELGHVNKDIGRILMQSRRNNPMLKIGGVLYFNNNYYFQCLEGEQEDVDKTYKKIIDRYSDRNLELIEQSFEAKRQGNDSLANKLDSTQKSILAKKYLATISFALSNKDFEISPYLMVSHVNDAKFVYLDSVYNNLTPKIKDSKYGKDLESLMQYRKNLDN